jgi:16S rRNA (guanine(527)-N(7))-methyltransferase RsmG
MINYTEIKIFSDNFLKELTGKHKGLNLTNILVEKDFYYKQILDSIMFCNDESNVFLSQLKQRKTIIDVGFGCGVPILPLAFIFPDYKFIGIESRLKKVNAVKEIVHSLNLKNVSLVHGRIEDMNVDIDSIIISKAVSSCKKMMGLVNNTTDINQIMYFLKSINFESLENNDFHDDWEEIERLSYKVNDSITRYLVGFIRKKVPRRTKISKEKLSELVNWS